MTGVHPPRVPGAPVSLRNLRERVMCRLSGPPAVHAGKIGRTAANSAETYGSESRPEVGLWTVSAGDAEPVAARRGDLPVGSEGRSPRGAEHSSPFGYWGGIVFWKSQLNRLERSEKGKQEKEREEERKRAEKLQRKKLGQFRCQVGRCRRKARRPYVSPNEPWLAAEERSDHNRPGDLSKCARCGKYACARHIHKYKGELVCRECGKEILRGGGRRA
jgi:hypothetical protein